MIDPEKIPADFPVQPIDPDDPTAVEPTTCGTCGLTWDDGKVTSWTPTPSGRCPFEYFHENAEEREDQEREDLVFRLYVRLGNDAMRTSDDLSATLRKIADDVDHPRASAPFAEIDGDGNLTAGWYQTILDANGNDVGRYAVKSADE